MGDINSYQSGTAPIGVQVSENPDIQVDMTFDEYQIQQFQVFEKEYGRTDTEIRKHPEWNGTFMNYFLHAEGKGQYLKPYYEVADWLSKHPLPSDAGSNQIGSNPTILSNLLAIYKSGHSLPEKLPLDEDGNVDEFMFEFMIIRDKLIYEGHEILLSGRVSMNNVGILEDDYIYAEGNRKAYEIFCSLGSMSQHNYKGYSDPNNMYSMMADNIWSNASIKLAFDDMNIRGIQIVDALEYADGSIQKLYEHMNQPYPQDTRDPNICKYCNMKAAQRIRDKVSHSEYIAVSDGASFDKQDMSKSMMVGYRNPDLVPYRYKMSVLNYTEYLQEVQALSTDWSKIDIIQNTALDQAIKAAEARGFKKICETGKRKSWGDECRAVLMYNPDTGAFIHMPCAQDQNACYGGCDMDFWSKTGDISWRDLEHASGGCVNHYSEIKWNQVTYNEGLFSSYDNIAGRLHASDIDWNKLGFIGHDTIPVARYYDKPFVREDDLSMEVGFPLAHMMCDMGGYRLQCVINTLIAHYDQSIDLSVCPQYAQIRDDSVAFPAAVYHLSTWSIQDVGDSIKLCRLLKLYLNMPDSEYEKLLSALSEQLRQRDQRELERINDPDNLPRVKKRLQEEYHSLGEYFESNINMAYGFDNDALLVEKALSADGRGIETLGVKLPWM